MKTFGLIGYPLGHSFSQKYFTEKFQTEHIDAEYQMFPLEKIELVEQMLQSTPTLVGFNVTIPYKQQIMRYLDDLDDEARQVGAVNVVRVLKVNGETKLKGYNSDIYGFYTSIKPFIKPHHKKALILGTGGASKAVCAMLTKLGIDYKFVSRSAKPGILTYEQIDQNVLDEYTVIVNASPVGMYPNIDQCPALPYSCLNERHLAYDLVYNPLKTKFLALAEQQGAAIKNGLEMLHLQAERAWEIWNAPTTF